MQNEKGKRIAVVGATGFTGSELVRILHRHPRVELVLISSESRAGDRFSDVHPFFRGIVDTRLESVSALRGRDVDLAFFALPHRVSMEYVRDFHDRDFAIVDLSGDFRLSSPSVYEAWYGVSSVYPAGYEEAVYGIPELARGRLSGARLVANPGCYPTSVILGAAPLLAGGLVDPGWIVADSKSGITGAGVKAKAVNHFSAVNDNFKAYGLKTHRHSIEIQEQLGLLAGTEARVQFTPHLLPVDRGILSTIYMRPQAGGISAEGLWDMYRDFYRDAPFVRLCDSPPAIKDVRGTNFADIYLDYDERTGNIIVISVIDNLVRGAAGQAVQNMNLVFGWDERLGLDQIPMNP